MENYNVAVVSFANSVITDIIVNQNSVWAR